MALPHALSGLPNSRAPASSRLKGNRKIFPGRYPLAGILSIRLPGPCQGRASGGSPQERLDHRGRPACRPERVLPAARAFTMISGPIPVGSPMVMPTMGRCMTSPVWITKNIRETRRWTFPARAALRRASSMRLRRHHSLTSMTDFSRNELDQLSECLLHLIFVISPYLNLAPWTSSKGRGVPPFRSSSLMIWKP